jgi:hypothetical protein
MWCTKNYWKRNRIEKVMVPQNKSVQKFKKTNKSMLQASSQTPKKLYVCSFVVINVQRWFFKTWSNVPIIL